MKITTIIFHNFWPEIEDLFFAIICASFQGSRDQEVVSAYNILKEKYHSCCRV